MFNEREILKHLEEICEHYRGTAPVVADWADGLYIRMDEEPDKVCLLELRGVGRLRQDGQWLHPHFATNTVCKLLNRLGRDTVGMLDH